MWQLPNWILQTCWNAALPLKLDRVRFLCNRGSAYIALFDHYAGCFENITGKRNRTQLSDACNHESAICNFSRILGARALIFGTDPALLTTTDQFCAHNSREENEKYRQLVADNTAWQQQHYRSGDGTVALGGGGKASSAWSPFFKRKAVAAVPTFGFGGAITRGQLTPEETASSTSRILASSPPSTSDSPSSKKGPRRLIVDLAAQEDKEEEPVIVSSNLDLNNPVLVLNKKAFWLVFNQLRNNDKRNCIVRESNPGRPRGRRAFYL